MELALLQSAMADWDPLIKAGGSALPGMSPSAAPALGHSAPLQEKNVCKSHGSPVGDSSERGLIRVGTFGFFWGRVSARGVRAASLIPASLARSEHGQRDGRCQRHLRQPGADQAVSAPRPPAARAALPAAAPAPSPLAANRIASAGSQIPPEFLNFG